MAENIKATLQWEPDYDLLSAYNAETARGLVHTPEWSERMREIQERYNEALITLAANNGHFIFS